jgi:hypothetical protein
MEDKIPNGIPPFDGSNFEYWSNRMETYLKALGADVWFSVASGYNALNSIVPVEDRQLINSFLGNIVRGTLNCCKVQSTQKGSHCNVRISSGIINSWLIISLEQELDIVECFLPKTFK